MEPNFHLSIGVKSTEESAHFFSSVLNAKIVHRDPSGYINIDLYGSQITLKQNQTIDPQIPDFHFGVNLSLSEFNQLSEKILRDSPQFVSMEPEVWEAGTHMERRKMYLKCPTGYLVELKGYKWLFPADSGML